MKTVRRIFCAALALFMMLTIVSCGAEEDPNEVVKKALDNVRAASGYHAEIEGAIGVSVEGMTITVKMESNGDFTTDPKAYKMDMTMSMGLFGSYSTKVYYVADGDEYVTYTGTEYSGETMWEKKTMSAEELDGAFASSDASAYAGHDSINYTKAGSDTVNGVKATCYKGVITGEDMLDAITASNLTSQLDGLDMDDFVEKIGDMKGEVSLKIWITDDYYPVKVEVEMTEVLEEFMALVLDEAKDEMDSDELEDMNFSITEAAVSVTYSDYNDVEPIVVPDEVIQNAVDYSDLSSYFDFED